MNLVPLGARLALAVVLAVTASCGGQEGLSPVPVEDQAAIALPGGAGPYTFGANVGTGMCLDVNNGSASPRTNIQVWNCTGGEPQRFFAENQGGGLVRLVNTGTDRCVDVDNAGTADGTNIQLWPCNGTGSQKFRMDDGGGGKVRIVNPQSNKCLDVAGGVAPPNVVTNVQLYTCNGTNAQLWTPTSLAPPPKNVTAVAVSGDTVTVTMGADQLRLRAVKPEILSVDYLPGGASSPRTLVLDPARTWGTGNVLAVSTGTDPMTITTSKMVVKIARTPCRISVYDAAGALLLAEQPAEGLYADGVNLTHAAGETFYGVGGYDAWADASAGMQRNSGGHVTDGQQGWAGAPLVFTRRYGLLFDSAWGDFLVDSSRLEFSNVSRKDLEFYVVVGPPKTIVQDFAEITGKPPMFPRWSAGFVNTEWGTDQTEVTGIVGTYRSKGIPIDAFVLDFDWKAWGEDGYGEWRWNSTSGAGNVHPNLYPAGASGAFASSMAAQGVKLGGITKPRILMLNSAGTAMAAAQYATTNGCFFPWQAAYNEYFSNRPARDVDFSVAGCRSWFWGHFQGAYDAGIVGWWNDEADTLGPSGNAFQFMNMQRGAYEWQRGYSGRRVWSLNRNFFLGAQRYAYGQWSGDIDTGFASMAGQRARMLSSVNVGSVKWGMDTGGFNGHPSSENYARWMQFSALVPVFRVHGTLGEQRQPWVYGAIAEAAARNAMYLRYRLLPYVYAYERTAYETGLGLVRPLFYEFPDDSNVANTTTEWLFGDSLLAAPVVDAGQTTKSVYLPAGTWYDLARGTAYVGPQSIAYAVNATTWEDSPLFVRRGAIIPMQETQNWIGERVVGKVYLEVFPDTAPTSFTYYDDDGQTYQYEGSGYFKQLLTAQDGGASGVSLAIAARTGSYTPPALQWYVAKLHGRAGAAVTVNGVAPTRYAGRAALESAPGEGWATGTDAYGKVTYVKVAAGSARTVVVTGTAAPDRTVYEAEEAILQGGGAVNKNHAGYGGAGFVDGFWNAGATVKFHVRVPTAGSYAVALRYGNGSGSAKTLGVYVNGTRIVQTSLANLASWDTWAERAETLSLVAGDNVVAYQYAAGDTGNVNLDSIALTVP